MKTFIQFTEGNIEDLNLGGRKDAQKKAIDDMSKTKYDPTEGKRRGKKLLDKLLEPFTKKV